MVSSRKFSAYIKKELENFLKSNLHLKVSEYDIIHRDQSSISFLGHTIQLVDFYPKLRIKSKLLQAVYRYKNKVLQRLSLEKYKISKLQANKFKKRVLKHIRVMLDELGLTKKKQIDVLASLFSYKLLGDTLAQNVHFNTLRELLQFLFLLRPPYFALSSTPTKSFSPMDSYLFQNQNKRVINKTFQMCHVRSFKDLHIQKVCEMLKKIRGILKSKTKLLTELTIVECVEIKSKQIEKMYTHQLLKNELNKMVSPSIKKEEICQLLAGGLIN